MSNVIKLKAHFQKAHDSLADAQLLSESDRPEGACNRAYYALFHGMKALLYTLDTAESKTHIGTQNEFRKHFVRTGLFSVEYSSTISKLFNLRQGGDYEIDFEITLEEASAAVADTKQFLVDAEIYLETNGFLP